MFTGTLIFSVALFSFLTLTQTFSTGAPKTDSVCRERMPGHHVSPQKGTAPYNITVKTTTGNDVIEITIESESYFRGLLVQIISIPGSDIISREVVSIFEDANDTRALSCFRSRDTLTHVGKSIKKTITIFAKVLLQSPQTKYIVNTTMVRNFGEFWTNVTSQEFVISTSSLPSKPSIAEQWLKLAAKAGDEYSSSKQVREEGIRARFETGWDFLLQDGIVQTKKIKDSLPFTLFEKPKEEMELSFLAYQSDEFYDKANMSSKSIVTKFLKGDLRFANDVSNIINNPIT